MVSISFLLQNVFVLEKSEFKKWIILCKLLNVIYYYWIFNFLQLNNFFDRSLFLSLSSSFLFYFDETQLPTKIKVMLMKLSNLVSLDVQFNFTKSCNNFLPMDVMNSLYALLLELPMHETSISFERLLSHFCALIKTASICCQVTPTLFSLPSFRLTI